MTQSPEERIAVLENQVASIIETSKNVALENRNSLDKINNKLDEIFAVMNKGKGVLAAVMIFSGLIGGLIVKVGGVVFSK